MHCKGGIPCARTGTGKTKTILGLLSVLAAAIPADSPSLLKASRGGGGGGCSRSTAEWRDLRRRASPWACSGFRARCCRRAARPVAPSLPCGLARVRGRTVCRTS